MTLHILLAGKYYFSVITTKSAAEFTITVAVTPYSPTLRVVGTETTHKQKKEMEKKSQSERKPEVDLEGEPVKTESLSGLKGARKGSVTTQREKMMRKEEAAAATKV